MNLCSDIHEEIVFEGKDCPLCAAFDTINGLEREYGRLEEELAKVQAKEEPNA